MEVRSSAFAFSMPRLESQKRAPRKYKRVMLFYTPHNVWSLPAVAESNALLIEGFQSAIRICAWSLRAVNDVQKINLGTYANCLSKIYAERTSFKDHTGLRGLVVIPEILTELKTYSAPGRSTPEGYIVEIPVELPAFARQQFPGDIRLWVFANIPVVVSPLDCSKLLWDGSD